MKIFFGADYNAKKQINKLRSSLSDYGEVIDVFDSDNYIDMAVKAAELVSNNNAFGVLICGTGIGISIVANKCKGAYATRCVCPEDASDAKIINNANILCLSGKNLAEENIAIIEKFFTTKYQGRKPENIQAIIEIENLKMK